MSPLRLLTKEPPQEADLPGMDKLLLAEPEERSQPRVGKTMRPLAGLIKACRFENGQLGQKALVNAVKGSAYFRSGRIGSCVR